MLGVHGNGLTSLLWMKPTPRSTVMEFFFPGGFAHDYEYTTRALGMMHYGFWGDRFVFLPIPHLNIERGLIVCSFAVLSHDQTSRPWHTQMDSRATRYPSTAHWSQD